MKKDVFVWVARDNSKKGHYNRNNRTSLFYEEPTLDKFYNMYWINGTRDINAVDNLAFMVKKGQCKKYKLVEVKESEV